MNKHLTKIKTFVLGSVEEAKKITWPTKQQMLEYSSIVLGAIAVCLAVIAAVDYGLSFVVEHYILGV